MVKNRVEEQPIYANPTRKRTPSAYIRRILAGESADKELPPGIKINAAATAEIISELTDDYDEEYALTSAMSNAEGVEPRSLAEAKRLPEWTMWELAIKEELGALEAAGTWEIGHAPEGTNIVGSKWVFKIKRDASGKPIRYKARLVAQGFSQVPGVDFFETYAPIAKLSTIRAILAVAAQMNLEIHQVDVKSAYLNGEFEDDEKIFMKPPPGYSRGKNEVYKLKRPIYGLKQSGRKWYQKVTWIFINQMKFTCADMDLGAFFRRDGTNFILVVIHVDDFTIAATTSDQIQTFKKELKNFVEITDLGELHWLLGIEVKRDRDLGIIRLSQTAYIDSILRRFNFEDLKPVASPMDPNIHLSTTQSPSTAEEIALTRDIPYREAVGSLMYASLGTRPDISFAVTLLSKFSANPGTVHWEAVKRVFRYLKGTRQLWLTYGPNQNLELTGYTDADGSMQEDRKAISGNAFLINGGAVSWFSKSQEIISLSTTESEYIAATHAAKEAIWLRQLLSQLFGPIGNPTVIFSDNQAAISLTKNRQFHARTKHIDVRFHFLRWMCENGTIKLIYCPTGDMIADALTKPLPSFKVKHFAHELGLRTI